MYNSINVKKWLRKSYKNTLIYDYELGYILNGFVVLKVDAFLKTEIIKLTGIVGNINIRNGSEQHTMLDVKSLVDTFEKADIVFKDTEFICDYAGRDTKMFSNTEDDILTYIDRDYMELFDTKFSSLEYKKPDAKFNSAMSIFTQDTLIGVIMPIRFDDSKYEFKLARK